MEVFRAAENICYVSIFVCVIIQCFHSMHGCILEAKHFYDHAYRPHCRAYNRTLHAHPVMVIKRKKQVIHVTKQGSKLISWYIIPSAANIELAPCEAEFLGRRYPYRVRCLYLVPSLRVLQATNIKSQDALSKSRSTSTESYWSGLLFLRDVHGKDVCPRNQRNFPHSFRSYAVCMDKSVRGVGSPAALYDPVVWCRLQKGLQVLCCIVRARCQENEKKKQDQPERKSFLSALVSFLILYDCTWDILYSLGRLRVYVQWTGFSAACI